MSFAKDLALGLLPAGLAAGAASLRNRDNNLTGADDAFANVLFELAPVAPSIVAGSNPGDTITDKAFLGIYAASESYLRQRGKLPGQQPANQ